MNPVRALGRSSVGRLIAAGLVAAGGLIVIAEMLAAEAAAGHAIYHAGFAIAALATGGALIGRWPAGGTPVVAPSFGLFLLAMTQLVEGLGALGYGPDNDTRRSDLVVFHDLGLAITPVGLIAVVLGFGVAAAVVLGRRSGWAGRWATPAAVALVAVGVFLTAKMIGW